MFETSIEEKKDFFLVRLKGDLDVYSKDEFQNFFENSLENIKQNLVIDLEKLDYIDSTGLGMFINIYKSQKEKQKYIKIINPKENIKKLFKITDLTNLFDMEE